MDIRISKDEKYYTFKNYTQANVIKIDTSGELPTPSSKSEPVLDMNLDCIYCNKPIGSMDFKSGIEDDEAIITVPVGRLELEILPEEK